MRLLSLKDLDINSFKTRKEPFGGCCRSWFKWGDWESLSQVCNYAWEQYCRKSGLSEPFNPHDWMREHDWRTGRSEVMGNLDE